MITGNKIRGTASISLAGMIAFLTIISCNMNSSQQKGNHLVGESSPYLLQHAHNPVDWYPWGSEALEKAKKENKMMIISIGYAACHWCHVMEHESFEDDSVAQVMNENYVCIKVDREERPDIDDIYMTACHLATGKSCGWPLNAFALPDGRPVWAGTYFPKDRWLQVLSQFNQMFQSDLARLERSAEAITKGISAYGSINVNPDEVKISASMMDRVTQNFLLNMDFEEGGTKGAPKFPMPVNFQFLLYEYTRSGNEKVLEAITVTLDKMAAGGIYDHLGGGFARYAVDSLWRIPHFEKMLYDNAQLLSLYADGLRLTGKERYQEIVEETAAFMIRELMDESGGFYSSYDADSEGEEGLYYLWTTQEIDTVLGDDSNVFKTYFSCTEKGNWEGKNILYQDVPPGEIAREFDISEEMLTAKIKAGKEKMLKVRATRSKPGLDDKILASWNGLALSGLVFAYRATKNTEYLDAAEKSARFLSTRMIDGDYRVYRNFKDNKATINGFLDDYAHIINGLIDLYEQTFYKEWLETARKLMFYALDHFSDDSSQMFFYTSDLDPALIARKSDYTDNVIPGSNSAMAFNLFRLGTFYSNSKWIDRAYTMLSNMVPLIINTSQPDFYSNWCRLMEVFFDMPFEIAIMGENARALKSEFDDYYFPNAIFLGGTNENLPLLESKLRPGEDMIYVCRNKVCKYPVRKVEDAISQMK